MGHSRGFQYIEDNSFLSSEWGPKSSSSFSLYLLLGWKSSFKNKPKKEWLQGLGPIPQTSHPHNPSGLKIRPRKRSSIQRGLLGWAGHHVAPGQRGWREGERELP